jgi:hypothetical protein
MIGVYPARTKSSIMFSLRLTNPASKSFSGSLNNLHNAWLRSRFLRQRQEGKMRRSEIRSDTRFLEGKIKRSVLSMIRQRDKSHWTEGIFESKKRVIDFISGCRDPRTICLPEEFTAGEVANSDFPASNPHFENWRVLIMPSGATQRSVERRLVNQMIESKRHLYV